MMELQGRCCACKLRILIMTTYLWMSCRLNLVKLHKINGSWSYPLMTMGMVSGITIITVSYRCAIKLQLNYKVGIIIIPEGHPCQNGNEMAAMILTYPLMYCHNNTSCHLILKYTPARWSWHWYSFYKALQRFPQFTDVTKHRWPQVMTTMGILDIQCQSLVLWIE